MSTLWTPGGEVPVDRSRPSTIPSETPSEKPPNDPAEPDEAQIRAQMERVQQMMLERPAADIVAQHAMGLSELAVLHMGQPEPDLTSARLAIDALVALLEGLEGRLGDAEPSLRQILPQLRMHYVETVDRVTAAESQEGPEAGSR